VNEGAKWRVHFATLDSFVGRSFFLFQKRISTVFLLNDVIGEIDTEELAVTYRVKPGVGGGMLLVRFAEKAPDLNSGHSDLDLGVQHLCFPGTQRQIPLGLELRAGNIDFSSGR